MNDYTRPVYAIDGKEFRTVDGLVKFLFRKHAGACEVSGVRKDRSLSVYAHGSTAKLEIARYRVSAPEIGKPMTLSAEACL
jgi:hypothetical protein